MKKQKRSVLHNASLTSCLSSLLCVILGLAIGYLVLLLIEPSGAAEAIGKVLSGFFNWPAKAVMKYMGQTIVRTVPLLMCALSVLFAYKVGVFNIGVAGQFSAGACISLYAALAWSMPWYVCLLLGVIAAALWGAVSALLKLYCNVNVVISGIMLNWIALYSTNWILSSVKDPIGPETLSVRGTNPDALLPTLGLEKIFVRENTVTLAIPLAILCAVAVWVVLNKTVFGYELKATGLNALSARYAGMEEKRNVIVSMMISGGLAGLGAVMLYLCGIERWETTMTSMPAMGINGIAVAFLGGLHPLGAILAAFFIEYITIGGATIDPQLYSPQISDLITSLIIYLCAFSGFMKASLHKRQMVRKEKGDAEK